MPVTEPRTASLLNDNVELHDVSDTVKKQVAHLNVHSQRFRLRNSLTSWDLWEDSPLKPGAEFYEQTHQRLEVFERARRRDRGGT